MCWSRPVLMWNRFSLFVLMMVAVILPLSTSPARSEIFRIAIPAGSESVFATQIGAIRLALEHAPGNHELQIESVKGLTQSRVLTMLRDGAINLSLAGYSREWENLFLQVDYPLTRGMMGYRVFFARPELADHISNVQSIDELKRFCIGTGNDWLDTAILEANDLCVVKAPQGDALFSMLRHGRFDMFHRALHEAYVEQLAPTEDMKGLVLVPSLILRYPYDFFLYVQKNDTQRHAILTEGLALAYESGDFMRHFYSNPGMAYAMDQVQSPTHRILDIDNPEMSDQTRKINPELWGGF